MNDLVILPATRWICVFVSWACWTKGDDPARASCSVTYVLGGARGTSLAAASMVALIGRIVGLFPYGQ